MNLTTIKTLLAEKVNMIETEKWTGVCDHAIKCKNEFRRFQHRLDNYFDKLVTNTADSENDIDFVENTDSESERIEDL